MSPIGPISDDAIKSALTKLAAEPGVSEKLTWWLLGAHSAERWFQFELAYQLHQYFQGRYAVLCEKHWRDIVVIQLPPNTQYPTPNVLPLCDNAHAAAIEVKWIGNWYVIGNTFAEITADVAKIDTYDIPSMALVVWLLVEPREASPNYQWIRRQVASGIGVASAAEIETRVAQLSNGRFRLVAHVKCATTKEMDKMELLAYVCYNKFAI